MTLDTQRKAIQTECERRGWELVEVIEDDGYTGRNDNRPGLQRALGMLAKRNGPTAVVVARLDRLCRSMRNLAEFIDLSTAQRWSMVALDYQLDTTTANGRLVAHIIGAVAYWESDMNGERVSAGMRAAHAKARSEGKALGFQPATPPEVTKRIVRARKQRPALQRDRGTPRQTAHPDSRQRRPLVPVHGRPDLRACSQGGVMTGSLAPEPYPPAVDRGLHPVKLDNDVFDVLADQWSIPRLTDQPTVALILVRESLSRLEVGDGAPVFASVRQRNRVERACNEGIDRPDQGPDAGAEFSSVSRRRVDQLMLHRLRESQATICPQILAPHRHPPRGVYSVREHLCAPLSDDDKHALARLLLDAAEFIAPSDPGSRADRRQGTSDRADDGAEKQLQPLHADSLAHPTDKARR